MQSIYFCKKCSIDFPSVSRYLKHRKLFCELGRHDGVGCVEDETHLIEDNICKVLISFLLNVRAYCASLRSYCLIKILQLTIEEASVRVKHALETKLSSIDPAVYATVEEVAKYKRKRRENGRDSTVLY